MKMKKRLLSILLSLALVLGLMPGMVMTAYAAPDTTTYRLTFQGPGSSGTKDTTLPCTLDYNEWLSLVGLWSYDPVPEATVASGDEDCLLLENSNLTVKKAFTGSKSITNIFSYHYSVTITCLEMVNVNSISLDKDIAQTVNVGNNVAFTATVAPDNATDKKVKWSVGGTDAGAVKLYSNEACTTEVGTDATSTLTVYAKGISAGSATVTATSNADSEKKASCNVTVNPVTYTVTYKVVNGTWSDDSTTDKTETVQSGSKPASVPTGMKASQGFTGGAWDENPADATITGAKTFTYTFTAKQASTVTKAPTAKNLTYTGSAQELVTAGTATGGEMQYALGNATEATQPYTTSIPAKTEAGTYYVWYKVVGDSNHLDSDADYVTVTIVTVDSSDSGSSDSSAKVPYDDVPISTGSVNDITGTAAATAESNPFETKIENSSNLTTLLSLTDAEVAQGVNVWLDVQDMSSSVSKSDKSKIEKKSGDYTVGMYLDINLFKKVGNNDATKVSETNGKIKVSIVIPKKLRKSGRTFEIIRVHNGKVTTITGKYTKKTHTFTFETDKFSTYAIAYKDAASSTDSESTDSSSSATTSTTTASTGSTATTATAPKTGDASDMRVWLMFVIVSFAGLGVYAVSRKKKASK